MLVGPPDWKTRVVYWGLGLIFVVEFGQFVFERVWHVVGPLFK
jgi:hypothetical protein